jgi:hypothetical protein
MSAGLATKIVETHARGAEAVDVTLAWEITPAGMQALRGNIKRATGARFEIQRRRQAAQLSERRGDNPRRCDLFEDQESRRRGDRA